MIDDIKLDDSKKWLASESRWMILLDVCLTIIFAPLIIKKLREKPVNVERKYNNKITRGYRNWNNEIEVLHPEPNQKRLVA